VTILGLTSVLTSMGRCCNPVPGDPIIGYITRGRGATIHRRDCPNMLRIKDRERLVQVGWGSARQTYPVSVRIQAYDRDGLMRDVSTLVTNEGISMSSVNVATKNSLATFDLVMGIADLSQLSRVLNRLEALPNVLEARRLRRGSEWRGGIIRRCPRGQGTASGGTAPTDRGATGVRICRPPRPYLPRSE
jgi:GTP pyrophosphokinase